jgi:hypothetical protein
LALAGEGVVYVTTAGSARFPPQVYELDLDTGDIVGQRTATGQPFDLLIAADGRLWIAGDRHPDQPSGAGINVLDPTSLVVVDHVSLDGPAFALAQVGDRIWASTQTEVVALDPATLEVLASVPTEGPAYDLLPLPDGSGVVAVQEGRLTVVEATTVGRSLPVDADGAVSAAGSADAIWLRVPVDADSVLMRAAWSLESPPTPTGVELDAAGGGIVVTPDQAVVAVDERRSEIRCLPGGTTGDVSLDGTSPDGVPYAGVLAELPDGRIVLATSTAVAVAPVEC